MAHRSTVAARGALLGFILSVTLAASPAAAGEEGGLGIGVHGGTLGLGANVEIGVMENLSIRAMFSQLGLSYQETESGNRYEGDLDLQTIGLVADWRPVAGGLRVTGGVFANNNEVTATAQGLDVDIGGSEYGARLDMLLDFEPIAPYFGVGWSTGYGQSGLGFALDAGVLFQGSPLVSGSGTADGCSFEVSDRGDAVVAMGCSIPDLEADLESEHAELSGELEDFKWYPVFSLGVSYRF